MFRPFLLLATTFGVAQLARAQCPADRPLSFCCQYLNPFSDNAYVWNNVCGFYESDESVLVGTLCEPNVECSSVSYFAGYYQTCCQSTFNCQGDVDGAPALNCTGYQVE